jgi:UDP-glucose 4-epimerase
VRALVTGGAGFIGHHLVGALLAAGHDVIVLDDMTTGRPERLSALAQAPRIVRGSVLDPAAIDEAANGCEVIFHQAAIASVATSLDEPRTTDAVNVGGTIEVMLSAARLRVRRVVVAGSAAVYGAPLELPCREALRPAPTSPYGVAKLAAELYAHALGELHGVETVVLRYFNVYGPGQDPASEYAAVVTRFIAAVLRNERPRVHGDGSATRDFIDVRDVVAANLRAMLPTSPDRLTCNVATGRGHSLLELLAAIEAATGRRTDPVFGPPRAGDIHASVGDVTLARSALEWAARVPFEDGIARTTAWFRDHPGRGTGTASASSP